MASIFNKTNEFTEKPNRNTFDGNFVNNLTTRMGRITPCFCKEVIPGDSFQIDPKFGFNFQPIIFPIQTKMKASLHFFYVRNRALWRGWQDFITKQENKDGDSELPYIFLNSATKKMFNTGEIGDYLGIPTVYYTQGYENLPFAFRMQTHLSNYAYATNYFGGDWRGRFDIVTGATNYEDISYTDEGKLGVVQKFINHLTSDQDNYGVYPNPWLWTPLLSDSSQDISYYYRAEIPYSAKSFSLTNDDIFTFFTTGSSSSSLLNFNTSRSPASVDRYIIIYGKNTKKVYSAFISSGSIGLKEVKKYLYNSQISYVAGSSSIAGLNMQLPAIDDRENEPLIIVLGANSTVKPLSPDSNDKISYAYAEPVNLPVLLDGRLGIENKDRPIENLPFYSDKSGVSDEEESKIRISALPFRACEAIYNSFYRDDRNNPYILNDKKLYNTFIPRDQGGADDTVYEMHYRNWEADAYTTAVQSPQQGDVAPLVGVTASGEMHFQDEEGKSYYMQVTFEDDGHTIKGIKSYSSDMPTGTLHAMVDTISTGISINDFRNVNSLQRWLETNMRKGYRYKDQIEAHFGVSPTYSELNIPEFIGGISRDVDVNRVVQQSETEETPLGTLAGNASVFGDSRANISHFCDEHGWIIGFMTITPVPVYSQQLPKQLVKRDLLDFYFPEFGNIGYQPIFNQELAPLQCRYGVEGKQLMDVFGYQRAWHEYLANIDEVHGDFRTSMRDYLIQRVFKDVPQLSEEFLVVDPDVAENIFAVRDDSDKIFGQLIFNVKMKRPIPRLGIPRLE